MATTSAGVPAIGIWRAHVKRRPAVLALQERTAIFYHFEV
jgi:hypothetical protein